MWPSPTQCEEMQEFVQCVNSGIQIQEETERVRDAMNRITGFQVVDVPSDHDLKDVSWPHTPRQLSLYHFLWLQLPYSTMESLTKDTLGATPLSFTIARRYLWPRKHWKWTNKNPYRIRLVPCVEVFSRSHCIPMASMAVLSGVEPLCICGVHVHDCLSCLCSWSIGTRTLTSWLQWPGWRWTDRGCSCWREHSSTQMPPWNQRWALLHFIFCWIVTFNCDDLYQSCSLMPVANCRWLPSTCSCSRTCSLSPSSPVVREETSIP